MTTTQHRAIAAIALAGGIALTGVGGGYTAHATPAGKTTTCHYDHGNPHTIDHAGNGVPGHEKDTFGACTTTTPAPETPAPVEPTPEPSQTSTPTAPADPGETSPSTTPAGEPVSPASPEPSETATPVTPDPNVDPCRYGIGRHHPSCPALPPAPGRPTYPHTNPVAPSTPVEPSRTSEPAPLPAPGRPKTAPHTTAPALPPAKRPSLTQSPATAWKAPSAVKPAKPTTTATAPTFAAGVDDATALAYTGLNGQAVRDLGILGAALILGGIALTIAGRRNRH